MGFSEKHERSGLCFAARAGRGQDPPLGSVEAQGTVEMWILRSGYESDP